MMSDVLTAVIGTSLFTVRQVLAAIANALFFKFAGGGVPLTAIRITRFLRDRAIRLR
jgi:hypothetical protein